MWEFGGSEGCTLQRDVAESGARGEVCGGRQGACFTCDRQGADLHREYFGSAGVGTAFSWPRRVNPVLVGAESQGW